MRKVWVCIRELSFSRTLGQHSHQSLHSWNIDWALTVCRKTCLWRGKKPVKVSEDVIHPLGLWEILLAETAPGWVGERLRFRRMDWKANQMQTYRMQISYSPNGTNILVVFSNNGLETILNSGFLIYLLSTWKKTNFLNSLPQFHHLYNGNNISYLSWLLWD